MYQRCISSGSTGLCRCVRPVSVRADITPARPLRLDRFRHRPTHPDTFDFPFWEQEAESSNLSIPTRFAELASVRPRCRCISDVSNFGSVLTEGVGHGMEANGVSNSPRRIHDLGDGQRRQCFWVGRVRMHGWFFLLAWFTSPRAHARPR